MATAQHTGLPDAYESGRICAAATVVQRDLHCCVEKYAGLFPLDVFDPTLLSAVSLANTFASPWLAPGQLRAANRAALWTFGLDRHVDTLPSSQVDVQALPTRCLTAVRAGRAEPGDELAAFLVEIVDELRAAPAYAVVGALWHRELTRMLEAMAREQAWVQANRMPDIDTYLANSDNLAFAFVFATQLVGVTGAHVPVGIEEIFTAVRTAQSALRLVNDLATYERDRRTGDLNALALGVSRDEAQERVRALVATTWELLTPLRRLQPWLCLQIERQVSYNISFYASTDYWR